VLGLAAAAAIAVPASASASTDASPVAGHVYVNDNTKGANTIGAFDRHADGTLTPEAGSPFAAGGAGRCAPAAHAAAPANQPGIWMARAPGMLRVSWGNVPPGCSRGMACLLIDVVA
jgi:hypothetical protein